MCFQRFESESGGGIGRHVMGDLINGAVRHHIKYVDHPQEPNKIGLFNRTGSSPVLTTSDWLLLNNEHRRRKEVEFSQVAEGIEVTRSLVDAHIHTGMTQYCITVSYRFESCPDYSGRLNLPLGQRHPLHKGKYGEWGCK